MKQRDTLYLLNHFTIDEKPMLTTNDIMKIMEVSRPAALHFADDLIKEGVMTKKFAGGHFIFFITKAGCDLIGRVR